MFSSLKTKVTTNSNKIDLFLFLLLGVYLLVFCVLIICFTSVVIQTPRNVLNFKHKR